LSDPNESSKKLRIEGGRPATAKRVTVDLDSDDEIIVAMKKSGSNSRQIADRLRDEGRVNYKDKTITSRYARIMKAQAAAMERKATSESIQWQEDDVCSHLMATYSKTNLDSQLKALTQAVVAVDQKLLMETKNLAKRKWHMVVSHLRVSRPLGTFSKADCEKHFKQLVDHNNSDFLPCGSPSNNTLLSNSGIGFDREYCSALSSSPPVTDNSIDNNPSDKSSGDVDDESECKGSQNKAGPMKKKTSPDPAEQTATDAAMRTAITNRVHRAVLQKDQGNVVTWNAAACLKSYKPRSLPISASDIDKAGVPSGGTVADAFCAAPYTAPAPAVKGVTTMTASIASRSRTAEQTGFITNKVLVRGREVPEPAAAGRRLLVRNLPRWVTSTELQIVFKDFNM
jgi:hypothetical protein